MNCAKMLREIGATACITVMSQEKGLNQWKSDQFYNVDDIMYKTADLYERS